MKFTAKEIEHLTYRALHDYQYSDYAAYAPHLLEEFAKVNLEHVSSPAGANSPSAPEIVLNPTLAWPQRIYAFVGHYLHLRLENRNITPLEVLQAGILLLHMDFYSIDDVDLKNKLLNILAKQPHSLFDLYHLHIEHTENLYATTDAVVIDILMHVVKLHAKNIEDLDTSARQNAIGDVMVMTGDERDVQLAAKIWRRRQTIVTTQYTINALVLRLNAEFTSFLNKLNTQGTNIFEHQQLTQLIAFIMEYPFLHALSSNVQLYILHIVATLISNNSNNLVHAHYIEEVLRCLTTKGSRHAKAQLIKTLHEHLSPHLKEKFCAFLKQDLQANPQAYSTAIRELLYHYHFLFRDAPHLYAQSQAFYLYKQKNAAATTDNMQLETTTSSPVISVEDLNLLWNPSTADIDPQALKMFACTDFTNAKLVLNAQQQQEIHNLITKLSSLSHPNPQQQLVATDENLINATQHMIANIVLRAVDAKYSWWSEAQPVRFKMQGFAGDPDDLIPGGTLFISVTFKDGAYIVYNPKMACDEISFANSDAGIDELSDYILTQADRTCHGIGADTPLIAVLLTEYSRYVPINRMLSFRSNSSPDLHSKEFAPNLPRKSASATSISSQSVVLSMLPSSTSVSAASSPAMEYTDLPNVRVTSTNTSPRATPTLEIADSSEIEGIFDEVPSRRFVPGFDTVLVRSRSSSAYSDPDKAEEKAKMATTTTQSGLKAKASSLLSRLL